MHSCRCGKVTDYDEPVIFNDIVHEGMEIKEGFCGPTINHTARDLRAQLDELRLKYEKAKAEETKALHLLADVMIVIGQQFEV